ncbi:hypothetical protein CHS0354_013688 [Potamilus streckersoni]|uniref:Uncharacterized protein n=1 Tax=Potamilus streckersoni TaxID=2493646 RepID=A0AAE0RQG3_9BIVA|nr:hypothetical protein CHS0354_013688 [Potamilus streckersoni]
MQEEQRKLLEQQKQHNLEIETRYITNNEAKDGRASPRINRCSQQPPRQNNLFQSTSKIRQWNGGWENSSGIENSLHKTKCEQQKLNSKHLQGSGDYQCSREKYRRCPVTPVALITNELIELHRFLPSPLNFLPQMNNIVTVDLINPS